MRKGGSSFRDQSFNEGTLIVTYAFALSLIFSCRFSADASASQMNRCPDSCIICVNDLCVSRDEFMLHLNKNISTTTNYFYQRHKAHPDHDFWEKSFQGDVPMDYLTASALDRIVSLRVIQQLAVENELIKPFVFNDMREWWQIHNEERKQKLETGGVIYGPLQDSFGAYYDYFYYNLTLLLKDHLNHHRFVFSDSTLKEYYEGVKQEHFRYTPSVQVEYIKYPYDVTMDIRTIQNTMERLKGLALNAMSLKEVIGVVPKTYYQQATYSDTIALFGEENPDRERRMFANQLKPDRIKIFHSKEHRVFYLMKCLGREPDTIYAFDEVKKDVIWYYQEKKFDDLITSYQQNALVIKHQTEFQKIKILD